MAHFNFVISQNAKRGHCDVLYWGLQSKIKIRVPENILLQKSTGIEQ